MYQRIVLLVVLSLSSAFCNGCGNEFDILTNHYHELGCTPSLNKSGAIDQLSAKNCVIFLFSPNNNLILIQISMS